MQRREAQSLQCGYCTDCTKRAAVKKDKAKNRQVGRRVANAGDKTNQAPGDKTEQKEGTKARQRRRLANQAAGDKTKHKEGFIRTFARTTGAQFHTNRGCTATTLWAPPFALALRRRPRVQQKRESRPRPKPVL